MLPFPVNIFIQVGKESAQLNSEIQSLERQSDLINSSAASIHEALQLYEKHSMDDMLKGASFDLYLYATLFFASISNYGALGHYAVIYLRKLWYCSNCL